MRDAMDVLEAWLGAYNGRARPAVPLGSKGEAGGAQLRLKYHPSPDTIAILHLVAVLRDGQPAIEVKSFEGPTAEASVEAGLWASGQLGRRPGGTGGGG
jgi:hypothetical protein